MGLQKKANSFKVRPMETETVLIHVTCSIQKTIDQCKQLSSDLHDTMQNN